jgi:hypothetical protein
MKSISLSLKHFVLVALALAWVSPALASIPDVVKNRFVIGDPVWKEMIVRDDIAGDYSKCWNKLTDIVVDKGYELAYTDKDSGYVRTNPNSGLVHLKSNWIYEVKIVAKFVVNESSDAAQAKDGVAGKKVIEKLRVQVQGRLYRQVNGNLIESYSGYDSLVLQDIFNDLQLVFGRQ